MKVGSVRASVERERIANGIEAMSNEQRRQKESGDERTTRGEREGQRKRMKTKSDKGEHAMSSSMLEMFGKKRCYGKRRRCDQRHKRLRSLGTRIKTIGKQHTPSQEDANKVDADSANLNDAIPSLGGSEMGVPRSMRCQRPRRCLDRVLKGSYMCTVPSFFFKIFEMNGLCVFLSKKIAICQAKLSTIVLLL